MGPNENRSKRQVRSTVGKKYKKTNKQKQNKTKKTPKFGEIKFYLLKILEHS